MPFSTESSYIEVSRICEEDAILIKPWQNDSCQYFGDSSLPCEELHVQLLFIKIEFGGTKYVCAKNMLIKPQRSTCCTLTIHQNGYVLEVILKVHKKLKKSCMWMSMTNGEY